MIQLIRIAFRAIGASILRRRDWLVVASKAGKHCQISLGSLFIGSNVKIGSGSSIAESVVIQSSDGTVIIGKNCRVRHSAKLYSWLGRIEIGRNCTINQNVVMLGTGGITLGNQVMIAANTMIVANSHRIERTDIPIQDQGYSAKGIQIEDDVWIGANTTILDGVKISRGAVVGAGATVTKDVPPYSIVVGVPAQVKKYR